ncbi:hypothetical protein ARMSODRAFT_1028010 [Armillaria solidipes]|uniref:Uncharacterized protein n=1 Tax=Armillaria solidipes TaxID=1076256 RepID=A0A2H3B6R0_9AGAR|nr:hypothetical protein ARMSODRAFT_1028010 [Armillaria solidipes]
MMMEMTDFTRIASSTASNVDFAVSNGCITQAEADSLQQKLSSLQSTPASACPSASIPPPPPALPAPMENSDANVPPPPGAGANSIGLQQDPGQERKKSKFGKFWEGGTRQQRTDDSRSVIMSPQRSEPRSLR